MQNALVVVVDDLFGVVHTAVTDFDSVAVKYLAEFVSYVVADVLAEWRVVQENVVSLSVFAFDKAAPRTKKHLTKADINTPSATNLPRQPNAKTDSETTFSGTTLHSARTSAPTPDTNSSA